MRLTFLGTGPAEGVPRKGHRDPLCCDARRGGKSARLRSAALVQKGNVNVLIDAGPDVKEQLARVRIKRLDGIVITHAHGDAIYGLDAVRGLAPIVMPKARKERVRFGDLEITCFPVRHTFDARIPTRGFLFDKTLAYISDTRGLPTASLRLLRNIDTLILDAAAYFGVHIPTHLSPDQSIALAAQLHAQRLYLTQVGHSYPPHAIAEKEIRRFAKKQFGFKKVFLAYDGMEVGVSSK